MPLDFTIVISTRQRFGDNQREDVALEVEAPFAGRQRDYAFRCPNVDSSQASLLLFQSQGVQFSHPLEINRVQIFGGLPPNIDLSPSPVSSDDTVRSFAFTWSGNVMIIRGGVLEENNTLRVQSERFSDTTNFDDFIIDNVVVVFKTKV